MNPKKCQSKANNKDIDEECYNDIVRLLQKISSKDIQSQLCKITLEKYTEREISNLKLYKIFDYIKKVKLKKFNNK
jgi:hypothetical protein